MTVPMTENPPQPDPDLRAFCEQEIAAMLDRLYAAALRLTKGRCDAEDLVADTIVKVLDNLHSLQDRASFRGWVFRILHNTFISNCRTRLARPEDNVSSLHTPEGEAPEQFWLFDRLHQPFLLWWGNQEQEFLDRLMAEDMVRAIDALPDAFRMVVVLADIEGFSYREIADALELEVGTVRSRLSRGRSLLQKALWDYARETGIVSGPAPSRDER